MDVSNSAVYNMRYTTVKDSFVVLLAPIQLWIVVAIAWPTTALPRSIPTRPLAGFRPRSSRMTAVPARTGELRVVAGKPRRSKTIPISLWVSTPAYSRACGNAAVGGGSKSNTKQSGYKRRQSAQASTGRGSIALGIYRDFLLCEANVPRSGKDCEVTSMHSCGRTPSR